ncbi:MAG: GNAT family N-acetyltransferase [Firmicutes bacterium]|nr:GNAT family N-acetyltransferase [Bacillota bacterium]
MMIDGLTIQEMRPGEEETVSGLVVSVFNGFVAPGYSEEGRKTFLEYVTPRAISLRRMRPTHFFLTAWVFGRLAGVIEVRDFDHVALFFIEKQHHGKGIARALLDAAVERVKRERSEKAPLTVNSSPYAVPIYRRLGFVETAGEQLTDGILYHPMSREIG